MLSFQELYETYAGEVYRFVLWLAGDRFEAEVHKTTIRTETLKAYLFAIARNIYLERQRQGKRHVTLENVYADSAPEPGQRLDAQRQLQRVHRFLQTVSEIDRAAFILRVRHELPYAEIARVLAGCRKNNI